MNLNEDVLNNCGMCAAVVYEALQRVGSKERIRVMVLKKEMRVHFGESTVKKSICKLIDAGYVERDGESYDSRGHKYRIIK